MKDGAAVRNEPTCFPQTATLCSRSVGALAACQVHQTQLTHIHLAFVLQFQKKKQKTHSVTGARVTRHRTKLHVSDV